LRFAGLRPYCVGLSRYAQSLIPLGRIAGRLAAAGLVMFLLDAAVFRTFYASIVEPDSTTGSAERSLWNEHKRERSEHPEILTVGDSRIPIYARVANELTEETGYRFANIATPGTSPRCWYYMLRSIDPDANLYRAIVIPEYKYPDEDTLDEYDDRIRDLHYIVGQLRLTDAWEFAASFHSRELKLKALRGAIWKGFVYQTDFQEFLKDPMARLAKVERDRRDSWEWFYNFDGDDKNLTGLRADWENNRLEYTDNIAPEMREYLERELLRPAAPQAGRFRAYRQKWYGKILKRYEGTGTQLIFLRMARGPVARPTPLIEVKTSVVRDLEPHPNVIIMDEHTFDSLEQSGLFVDPLHMNGPGCRMFSRMLATQIESLLGRGRRAGS
jgi:hypothetical protein